jgi:hypothetical protein
LGENFYARISSFMALAAFSRAQGARGCSTRVPAGTILQASICAGQADGLPYEISVVGEAAHGDTAQASRSFVISKYNENISIVAPQV